LSEYLADYASPATKAAGVKLLTKELAQMPAGEYKTELEKRVKQIQETGKRDLYF
jgi:2-iminoacetate synthase